MLTRRRLCPSLAALSHLICHRHTLTANVSAPPPCSSLLHSSLCNQLLNDQLLCIHPNCLLHLAFVSLSLAPSSTNVIDIHQSFSHAKTPPRAKPSHTMLSHYISSSQLPSTKHRPKPIAWLGDGSQLLGSGSTTACSIGGGGAPQRETFKSLSFHGPLPTRSMPCIESC
jgi:hypothetical protein